MPEVTNITGLDNFNLTDQTRFDANTGDLLNNLMARLPSSVCFVAHNGNAYDFPVIKSEMENTSIHLVSEILFSSYFMKGIFRIAIN